MAVTYKAPGAVLTEREHQVPLDHAKPDGEQITVFTREVASPDGRDRPYLLFLQGGPGHEATRPTAPPAGWVKRALADYRLLLIDQRGTGRSTPVGDIPGDTAKAQAAYMTHLRADGASSGTPSSSAASWAWTDGASSARASVASPR
jgi:pimeloyl-ACP methyl ester carboxylesterase